MALTISAAHPIWDKLLTQKVQHKFSLFAANVAVEHAIRAYAKGGSDKATIIADLRQFFSKYEALVAADLAKIM